MVCVGVNQARRDRKRGRSIDTLFLHRGYLFTSKATKIDRKGVFSSVYMDKFLKIKTTIENCAHTQVIRHNSNSWIVDRPHPGAM